MIGNKVTIDGEIWYSQGHCSDGFEYGYVFKDEEAFNNHTDDVCYIPEHAFDDADMQIIDGEKFYLVGGYTRKDLEELTEDVTDEDGELLDIEYFFHSLYWCYPETRLNEILDYDNTRTS